MLSFFSYILLESLEVTTISFKKYNSLIGPSRVLINIIIKTTLLFRMLLAWTLSNTYEGAVRQDISLGLRGPFHLQNVWLQQQPSALPSATCLAQPCEA